VSLAAELAGGRPPTFGRAAHVLAALAAAPAATVDAYS
jgi:hypothetical protein